MYGISQKLKLGRAIIDRALGAPHLKRHFFRRHGYKLDLKSPKSFSEKVQWRKLNDYNPLFSVVSNKYLVRDYIENKLGSNRASRLLVPLLCYCDDPSSLDFKARPNRFVLKAAHGSGMNLVVEDASQINADDVRNLLRRWLLTHHRPMKHEWVYSRGPRCILVEKMIAPPEDLIDIKFYFFDGKMKGFLIIERIEGETFRTYFDSNAIFIDVKRSGVANNINTKLPSMLDEMIEIGEAVSSDFDFVRVDFMYFKQVFYLGELTLLPGSGQIVLEPASYNDELGSFWKIPCD
jgi:hypothetical protein